MTSFVQKQRSFNPPTLIEKKVLGIEGKVTQLPIRSKSKKSKSRKHDSNDSTQNKTKKKLTPNKPKKSQEQLNHQDTKRQIKRQQDDKSKTSSRDKTNPKMTRLVRKNNHNELKRAKSRRSSKKSSENQIEDSLVDRLKAQNEYYRRAYHDSKQSLQKLQRVLKDQKQRRSSEKVLYQTKITTLQRKLSADKIRLNHIFTFDSFKEQMISDMILQVQNQSSMLTKLLLQPECQSSNASNMSNLSINSK